MQFALLRGNYVIWWVPSSYGLVLLGILRLMAGGCHKFFIFRRITLFRLLAGLQIAAIHIRAVDDLDPHDIVLLRHRMGRLLADQNARPAIDRLRIGHMLFELVFGGLRLHPLHLLAAAGRCAIAAHRDFNDQSTFFAFVDFQSFHNNAPIMIMVW